VPVAHLMKHLWRTDLPDRWFLLAAAAAWLA
jgi:hypothetical protein